MSIFGIIASGLQGSGEAAAAIRRQREEAERMAFEQQFRENAQAFDRERLIADMAARGFRYDPVTVDGPTLSINPQQEEPGPVARGMLAQGPAPSLYGAGPRTSGVGLAANAAPDVERMDVPGEIGQPRSFDIGALSFNPGGFAYDEALDPAMAAESRRTANRRDEIELAARLREEADLAAHGRTLERDRALAADDISLVEARVAAEESSGSVPDLSEGEQKSVGFFRRGVPAYYQMEQIVNEAFGGGGPSLAQDTAARIPFLGNYLTTEDMQRFQQASRNMLSAILRKDTGAAITDSEMRIYGEVFLPRSGDKRETVRQKLQASRIALNAIRETAGGARWTLEPMQVEEAAAGMEIDETSFLQSADTLYRAFRSEGLTDAEAIARVQELGFTLPDEVQ